MEARRLLLLAKRWWWLLLLGALSAAGVYAVSTTMRSPVHEGGIRLPVVDDAGAVAVCKGAMKTDSGEMSRMAWARLELPDLARIRVLYGFMDGRRRAGRKPQEAVP